MTAVGPGDIAPRTVPGRLLGIAIMFMGIGLTAILTANIVAASVEKEKARLDSFAVEEVGELRRELAAVTAWLEALEAGPGSRWTVQQERGGTPQRGAPSIPAT